MRVIARPAWPFLPGVAIGAADRRAKGRAPGALALLPARKGRIRPPSVVIGLLDGTLSSSQHAAGHATDVATSESLGRRRTSLSSNRRQYNPGPKADRNSRPLSKRFCGQAPEFTGEGLSPPSDLEASDPARFAFGEHARLLRDAQLAALLRIRAIGHRRLSSPQPEEPRSAASRRIGGAQGGRVSRCA